MACRLFDEVVRSTPKVVSSGTRIAPLMTRTPKRVLIVDDQPDVLRAGVRLLRQAGHEVLEAGLGGKALDMVQNHHPDLVLLDVMLPDIDGFEVCQRIKSDPSCSTTFVVLCSAQAQDAAHVARGYAAGADGYILRPVQNAELVARVDGLLRHKDALDRLHASERLYRSQFERNPQPMWIYALDTGGILAANAAAARLYGCAPEAMAGRKAADLFEAGGGEDFWRVPREDEDWELEPFLARQRRADGSWFSAEIFTHGLEWSGQKARAVLVVDLTDRVELAAERARQQARMEGEMASLESYSKSGLRSTARALGVAPLSEAAPEEFNRLKEIYASLLDRAFDQKILRMENAVSPALRELADQLFFLLAGPRDVSEIHYQVMNSCTDRETPPRARGHLEAGRLMLIELMGYLVAAYRNHHITVRRKPGLPPPRPPATTTTLS